MGQALRLDEIYLIERVESGCKELVELSKVRRPLCGKIDDSLRNEIIKRANGLVQALARIER